MTTLALISRAKERIQDARAHLHVPLYQNAYFLMLNTASTSLLGVLYWMIAPRLFSSQIVGESNTLLNAFPLVSAVGQLTFVQVLQRFLPVAGTQAGTLVKTAYRTAVVASFFVASITFLVIHLVTPSSYVLHAPFFTTVLLVLCVVSWTLFAIQDGALIGLRQAKWVFFENAVFGIAKIALLFVAAAFLRNTTGFVGSWVLPLAISIIPVSWLIFRVYLPGIVREGHPKEEAISQRTLVRFIAGDYPGWLSAQLLVFSFPILIPLLIPGNHGQVLAGYLSLSQPIATALNLFTSNLMSSLIVEAASDAAHMTHYARLIAKRFVALVLPMAVLVFLLAPYILRLGNEEYSKHATTLLRLLAISTVPAALILLSNAVARLRRRTVEVTITQVVQAVGTIGGMVWLVPKYELTGVGIAVLLSATVVAIGVTPGLVRDLSPRWARRQKRRAAARL